MNRAQSFAAHSATVIRSQAVRLAPALISVAVIGMLAASRLTSAGATQPSANLNLGQQVVFDEVASTDVAAAVADMTDMIVADQVIAQAQSLGTESDLTGAAENQLSKPQLVATEVKTSGDITKHVVAEGETVESIANTYNVTTDTIKWANNLSSNTVNAGTELTILPVNGMLHTVNAGDTPESLAQHYRTSAQQIVAFNDAEVSGLVPGQQIVVPDGTKPAPAARRSFDLNSTGGRYVFGSNGTFLGRYTQFGLRSGWCTHWAAFRAAQLGNPVGPNWGSASRWPSSGRNAGYVVDHSPRVGAVAQRGNHVVVIEAVSEDGSMVKYSDMNGVGGWGNAVYYNDWIPTSSFANYIHR